MTPTEMKEILEQEQQHYGLRISTLHIGSLSTTKEQLLKIYDVLEEEEKLPLVWSFFHSRVHELVRDLQACIAELSTLTERRKLTRMDEIHTALGQLIDRLTTLEREHTPYSPHTTHEEGETTS